MYVCTCVYMYGWMEDGVSWYIVSSQTPVFSSSQPASLPPESRVYKSLQVISYIGCIISLLCLLATIIFLISLRSVILYISTIMYLHMHTYVCTYTYYMDLYRKELFTKLNQFVHLNLCIALACGLLVFMVGAQTAKDVPVS